MTHPDRIEPKLSDAHWVLGGDLGSQNTAGVSIPDFPSELLDKISREVIRRVKPQPITVVVTEPHLARGIDHIPDFPLPETIGPAPLSVMSSLMVDSTICVGAPAIILPEGIELLDGKGQLGEVIFK